MSYPITWQDLDNLLPEDDFGFQEQPEQNWDMEYRRQGEKGQKPKIFNNFLEDLEKIIWNKYDRAK